MASFIGVNASLSIFKIKPTLITTFLFDVAIASKVSHAFGDMEAREQCENTPVDQCERDPNCFVGEVCKHVTCT